MNSIMDNFLKHSKSEKLWHFIMSNPSTVLFSFLLGIASLSAHSDHCRVMGCKAWRRDNAPPGRNGRRPGESKPMAKVIPRCVSLVRTPPASSGHQLPGGDSRWASILVDDVHQARITKGVRKCGMTFGGTNRWIA